MIELLTDEEGQPLIISESATSSLWSSFNILNASEFELVSLLKKSSLTKLEELDYRISNLLDLKIFNLNCLEYLSEIYPNSKRFDKNLSYNLVIQFNDILAIISIRILDNDLSLISANKFNSLDSDKYQLTSNIINSLLHWLWLYINTY